MLKSKVVISGIFLSFLLIGYFQLKIINKQPQIATIYADVSNLDVNLQLNNKQKTIKFTSVDDILSVLIFNSKGEVIRKDKPKSNIISIKDIKDQELYLSFISSDKIAFKSILY